jgi:hypothetical protein
VKIFHSQNDAKKFRRCVWSTQSHQSTSILYTLVGHQHHRSKFAERCLKTFSIRGYNEMGRTLQRYSRWHKNYPIVKTLNIVCKNLPTSFKMRFLSTFSLILIAIISFTASQAINKPVEISSRSPETPISGLLVERATAGQDCSGSEGMWNCMTNSFQRCASGRWSEVMQCAAGTHCSPVGMGYQFNVVSGSSTAAYSSNANSGLENRNENCWFYVLSLALYFLATIQ